MWSKCGIVLLLIAFESRLICGQPFFRKGYEYVEALSNFYNINTAPRTWSQAKMKCYLDGATLFYPEDEKEASVIMGLLNTRGQTNDIFIGIATWNVREVFETVDGRLSSDVYNNYAPGEPNNLSGNEGCIVMQKDGTLRDENCQYMYPFICKKTLNTLQWNEDCQLPDPDYKYIKEMDTCYKFHLTPKNWSEAFITCNTEQSYLAIINSPEENNHLITLTAQAPKDDIGGHYLRGAVHLGFHNKNGIWETIKGVPLENSGFVGWGYTQPDGKGTEDCGSMFYTGQLNDIGCWQRMFFICEHEIDRRADRFKYNLDKSEYADVSVV